MIRDHPFMVVGIIFGGAVLAAGVLFSFLGGAVEASEGRKPQSLAVWNIIFFTYWIGYWVGRLMILKVGRK